ncbi:hypothetical protein EUGRSUZ_G00406 [Eucalyptus grandis]|uniref:Uncharacterized protein n=2 Tax=Eucalyptus grandis TaxID=71139 RepID=A0ACC3JZT0_EUCGR|nr:hypothetical protein EUGRSUZ_G00406 [Eucalyptus grandis]
MCCRFGNFNNANVLSRERISTSSMTFSSSRSKTTSTNGVPAIAIDSKFGNFNIQSFRLIDVHYRVSFLGQEVQPLPGIPSEAMKPNKAPQ